LRGCVCGGKHRPAAVQNATAIDTEPEYFASYEDRVLKRTVVPDHGIAEAIVEMVNANLWPYRVTCFNRSR
jgi:hypothetical protein